MLSTASCYTSPVTEKHLAKRPYHLSSMHSQRKRIAIIGSGPSGLMAAEIMAEAGHQVTVYDRMPSAGRKLLMAGRGGLNLTHSEALDRFLPRYGDAANWLAPSIQAFPPDALRRWCEGLGQETFVGSSGRIFPRSMKAAPLLRAWLRRLEQLDVRYASSHDWHGWDGNALHFTNAKGNLFITADAVLLALGGASWPRLGSNGGWVKILADGGVDITPLRPANCGFTVAWSEHFISRFAGQPLKPVTLTHHAISRQGEAMITSKGIEGGAVYALSAPLRDAIERDGSAVMHVDLRPDMHQDILVKKLSATRGNKSLSTHLRSAGLSPLAIGLLREVTPPDHPAYASNDALAARLKSLPITLNATTGLARAISSAGGIRQSAVNEQFMLRAKEGIFIAGEMLDWEAPTGGYLLQACFSTAVAAANGMLRYCKTEG